MTDVVSLLNRSQTLCPSVLRSRRIARACAACQRPTRARLTAIVRDRLDVGAFAFQPRRFWLDVRIRARLDKVEDAAAELHLNQATNDNGFLLAELRRGVFNGVMQQRSDCFVFIGAELECNCGDGEQVGDVRDGRAFARLMSVEIGSQYQRFGETKSEGFKGHEQ